MALSCFSKYTLMVKNLSHFVHSIHFFYKFVQITVFMKMSNSHVIYTLYKRQKQSFDVLPKNAEKRFYFIKILVIVIGNVQVYTGSLSLW